MPRYQLEVIEGGPGSGERTVCAPAWPGRRPLRATARPNMAEVLHRHPGVFEAGGRHHDQVDEDPARRTDGGVHDPVQDAYPPVVAPSTSTSRALTGTWTEPCWPRRRAWPARIDTNTTSAIDQAWIPARRAKPKATSTPLQPPAPVAGLVTRTPIQSPER